MIMTEPVLQALYDKYYPCHITYRTHRHYYDLLLFHPLIDEILCTRTGCWTPTPEGYDIHVNLHEVIEKAPFGVHGIDAFALAAGVKLPRRIPRLALDGVSRRVRTEDDRYPVVTHPPVKIPPKSDISFHIPHETRNLSWKDGMGVLKKFMDYFNSRGEKPSIRLVGQDPMEPGKSHMLKMAWEIKQSKMFVGPDSGGFHISVALDVPTIVSLTSKFPASMRGYSKAVAVEDDLNQVFPTALALYRKIKNG